MKTYSLFISHSWTHSDAYENLCKLLDGAPKFSYRNYFIQKYDPVHFKSDSVLYEAIKQKMIFCNVVIILAGVYSSYSKWIEKEIKIAINEFDSKKPIIAVEPWGSEKTSRLVKDNADVIVGWGIATIIDAIRRNS